MRVGRLCLRRDHRVKITLSLEPHHLEQLRELAAILESNPAKHQVSRQKARRFTPTDAARFLVLQGLGGLAPLRPKRGHA